MELNKSLRESTASAQDALLSKQQDPYAQSPVRSSNAPRDNFFLFYVVVVLQGMAALLPWNALLAATNYYRDKFTEGNAGANFNALFPTVYCTVNLIMIFVISFALDRLPASRRIVFGSSICAFAFVGLTILAAISEIPQGVCLGLNWMLIVIVGTCAAICNNGYFSFLANFPSKYVPAFTMGQAIAGIIPPLTDILLSFAGSTKDAVYTKSLIFFALCTMWLVFAWFSFTILLPRTRFYKHYSEEARIAQESNYKSLTKDDVASPMASSGTSSLSKTMIEYWTIFKKIWIYAVAVFFVFQVTLFLFPHFQFNTNSSSDPNSFFTKNMGCFGLLFYSIGDWIGKISPSIKRVQIKSSKKLLAAALCRYVFLILFFFGNYKVTNKENIPAFLGDNSAFIIFTFLLGVTNGYFGTLCMMFGPGGLPDHEKGRGAAIMVFFLAAGLSFGSYTSLILNAICNSIVSPI